VGAFHLRIQAEAGSEIGDTPTMYQVRVQAACLTNPLANMFPFPNILNAVIPAVAFNAGGWEYQASEETFTRSWSIPFPNAVLLPGWHTNQVWQFFVTLEDPSWRQGSCKLRCKRTISTCRMIKAVRVK